VSNFVNSIRTKGFKGSTIWYFSDLGAYFPYFKQNLFTTPNYPPHSSQYWREYYKIVEISDNLNAVRTGTWSSSNIFGFNGPSIYTDNAAPASINYNFEVPADGYYEVYAYNVAAVNRTDSAHYLTTDSSGISVLTTMDQTDVNLRRWFKLGDYFLKTGRRNVVTLTNDGLQTGKLLSADAVMIVLNRRLSPSAVSSINEIDLKKKSNKSIKLKSYPNPFNNEFKLIVDLPGDSEVNISLFNSIGQKVKTPYKDTKLSGYNELNISLTGLPSGVYFVRVEQSGYSDTIKILLNK
jgi:hypothetical protein